MTINEDMIIAQAFASIRSGIVNGDWNIICKAYKDISGESLEPPKSRLEKIRESMKQVVVTENTDECQDEDDETPVLETLSVDLGELTNWKAMKKDDITNEILLLGAEYDDFKDMKKNELVEFATKFEKSIKHASVTVKENKNNSFARGKIQIISTPLDEKELEMNKERRRLHPKMTRPMINNMPKDNSNDSKASVRFYENPPKITRDR